MKRCRSRRSLLVASACSVLVLLAGVEASASDGPETAADTPAILAALDASDVTVLDDREAMSVRGQAYQYVLVRILGLNTFDFAPGLDWTWNPFGYRYGAWGGPGWSNGGLLVGLEPAADDMDAFFMAHDLGFLSDAGLVGALVGLATAPHPFWGPIYVGTDIEPGSGVPVGTNVWVASASLFANKLYFGWRPMPAPEYFRRQALVGMRLVTLLP